MSEKTFALLPTPNTHLVEVLGQTSRQHLATEQELKAIEQHGLPLSEVGVLFRPINVYLYEESEEILSAVSREFSKPVSPESVQFVVENVDALLYKVASLLAAFNNQELIASLEDYPGEVIHDVEGNPEVKLLKITPFRERQ